MFAEVKLVLSWPIIPRAICLVLLCLLIWQIFLDFHVFSQLNQLQVSDTQLLKKDKLMPKQLLLTAGINYSFFGDYVPKTLNEAGVKQSRLDFTVVGIMFAEDEAESHVIIRTAGGHEKTYHVGDSLPGGVIIKRITSDGVLIRQNGLLESLQLPRNELLFEAPAKPLEKSE